MGELRRRKWGGACGRGGGWGLRDMHQLCIMICMRTTLNIDDELLATAAQLTGVTEKTALVRLGLEALVARESARRLARLAGSDPTAMAAPRRRPGK